jgi:hypothetical protein
MFANYLEGTVQSWKVLSHVHGAKPYMCLAWGLDQISMGSERRRSRLRGSVEVEGPQLGAPILLLVVLAKCDSTERPCLEKRRRPQGSPRLPSRPLLPPQPSLLHASVASIAGRNEPQHELPDQRGSRSTNRSRRSRAATGQAAPTRSTRTRQSGRIDVGLGESDQPSERS